MSSKSLGVLGWGMAVFFFTGGVLLHAEDQVTPSSATAVTAPDVTPPAEPSVAAPPTPASTSPTEIGASACLACHDKIGENFARGDHGRGLVKIKGLDFEKTCEACHGPGSAHADAAGDRSNPGFASLKVFKTMSAQAVVEACQSCHNSVSRSHWSGGAHDRAHLSCLSCHSVHSPQSSKANLVKANEADTCYTCHGGIRGQMRRSAHMPVEDGKMSCSSCHNAHNTENSKMIKAASVNQLCYQCHQDKRGPTLWKHPPVQENCLNCHQPHGSHYDNMLLAKAPFLCQRCHGGVQHPSTLYDATGAANQQAHIITKSCLNCHSNIHGSNHPSGKTLTR